MEEIGLQVEKPFNNVSLVVKEFISSHSFNGKVFASKKRY
jgi:hypothetical protein